MSIADQVTFKAPELNSDGTFTWSTFTYKRSSTGWILVFLYLFLNFFNQALF